MKLCLGLFLNLIRVGMISLCAVGCTINPATIGNLASSLGLNSPSTQNSDPTQGLGGMNAKPSPPASPSVSSVELGADYQGPYFSFTGDNLTSVMNVALYEPNQIPRIPGQTPLSCRTSRYDINDGTTLRAFPIDDISSLLLSGFTLYLSTSDPNIFTTVPVSGYTPPPGSTGRLNIGPTPSPSATPDLMVNRAGCRSVQIGGTGPASSSVCSSPPKVKIVGEGDSSSTSSFEIRNSSARNMIRVYDNGNINLGSNANPLSSVNFNGPVTAASPSLIITGNTSIVGSLAYAPRSGALPITAKQLSVAQTGPPGATVDVLSGGGPPSLGLQVVAPGPSPLFMVQNNGTASIAASPSPWPTPDVSSGLQVPGNLRITSSTGNAQIIIAGAPFTSASPNLVPNDNNCNADRKGYVTLDRANLLCFCNGANWRLVGDGTRGCFIHTDQNCSDTPVNVITSYDDDTGDPITTPVYGVPQAAPTSAPARFPAVGFCKFSGGSCPTKWTKYSNYSRTEGGCKDDGCGYCNANTCSYVSGANSCCNTPEHSWSDTDPSNESCRISYSACNLRAVTQNSTIAEIGCY